MRIIFCLMVFLFIGKNTMLAQQLSSFVEYGAALHTGDNTPLWQVSNQQGLTSLDNNTYIRGLRRHPLQVVWILCRKPGTEFSIAESRAEQWRHDLVG